MKKFVDGCSTCEAVRMKTVRAWAVVRRRRLQGKIVNSEDLLLVLSTRKAAMHHKLTDDRIVRVEIREIE